MTTTVSDLDRQSAAQNLPVHLTRVPGEDWAFWRSVVLRGAGFPVDWVMRVAAPASAGAADDLIAFEEAQRSRLDALTSAVRNRLDSATEKEERAQWRKALEKLRKGRLPESIDSGLAAKLEAAREAMAQTDRALVALESRFQEDLVRISDAIAAIANEDRFRQAVLLQNRQALNTVARSFAGPPGSRDRSSRQRQHEELIASYLQRYCVKNDSIGFFGPVAWVKFDAESRGLDIRPGPELIRRSEVYFEHWAVDALAETIATDPAVRPWIPPRARTEFRLEGNRLHHPNGSDVLPVVVAAVLAECDGVRTVPEIAARFSATLGPRALEIVMLTLERLAGHDVINWRFEMPMAPYPDRALRAMLARIEPDDVRASALQKLDELEAARARVADALGSADRLDEALGNLDREFHRLTGKAGTRSEGQMYASRTLVYLDCARDIEMRVGAEVLTEIARPLSLLVASLRWLTHRAEPLYREALHDAHARLKAECGTAAIDVLKFWSAMDGVLFTDRQHQERKPLHRALIEFHERWESVLQIPEGARRLSYASNDLRDRVLRLFDAPRAGWQMARYLSPDLMISAAGVEAIERGDYTIVLGEVHTAYNTGIANFAMCQHPAPEDVTEALTLDMPEPQVWILPRRGGADTTIRTNAAVRPRRECYLDLFGQSYDLAPPRERLHAADYVVESTASGLIVRSRDGRRRFDALSFFVAAMTAHVLSAVRLLPHRSHTPRITLDRMVLSREAWAFPATELAFVRADNERDRFLGARRWMKVHDLPRLVFFRIHLERKPLYLDFESPVYVEMFCKSVRRVLDGDEPGAMVTVSEMLPTPDQTWLRDASGNLYTSELRTVVLDLK